MTTIRSFMRVLFVLVQDNTGEMEIPDYVIEDLARTFLPDIIAFYESEEGKRLYAEWLAEQKKDASPQGL